MKALTLTQPWATLIAIGAKKIETRSWNTKYRGPLAIHAALGGYNDDIVIADTPFRRALEKAGITSRLQIPLGCIVAICELSHIDKILGDGYAKYITEDERWFGDYSVGRFAWYLENISPLAHPIAAKGSLGLWDWEERKEEKCLSRIDKEKW